MDNKNSPEERENPDKVYRDELNHKGSFLNDTPAESMARDKAKIEKSQRSDSQKMDGIHPDELDENTKIDDDLEEERKIK